MLVGGVHFLGGELSKMRLKWHEIEGWFTDKERNAIQPLAKDKICVEVGSYKGRSTFCIAEVAAHVHAVDTFMAGAGGQFQVDKHTTLGQFKENTARFGNITRRVGLSLVVAGEFSDESVELIFLDATHSYDDVTDDIKAWWPKLIIGGLLVFHDYGGGYHGVKQAVDFCFTDVLGVAEEHELAWVVKDNGSRELFNG